MYGDDYRGIMIAINFDTILDVFATTKFSFDGQKQVDILPLLNPLTTKTMPTNGYLPEIVHIKYTDDESLIKPGVVSVDTKTTSINLNANGQYKTTSWQFQEEVRFSISILPWSLLELFDILNQYQNNTGLYILNALKDITPSVDHLDITLNKDIFKHIKILFGPKCSRENKNEIQSLINNLELEISCSDSKIPIR